MQCILYLWSKTCFKVKQNNHAYLVWASMTLPFSCSGFLKFWKRRALSSKFTLPSILLLVPLFISICLRYSLRGVGICLSIHLSSHILTLPLPLCLLLLLSSLTPDLFPSPRGLCCCLFSSVFYCILLIKSFIFLVPYIRETMIYLTSCVFHLAVQSSGLKVILLYQSPPSLTTVMDTGKATQSTNNKPNKQCQMMSAPYSKTCSFTRFWLLPFPWFYIFSPSYSTPGPMSENIYQGRGRQENSNVFSCSDQQPF